MYQLIATDIGLVILPSPPGLLTGLIAYESLESNRKFLIDIRDQLYAMYVPEKYDKAHAFLKQLGYKI